MQKEITYTFTAVELNKMISEALKSKGITFDRFTVEFGTDPNDDSPYPAYKLSGLTVYYKEPKRS